jgi:MYXO-CTERM domain-containing protein
MAAVRCDDRQNCLASFVWKQGIAMRVPSISTMVIGVLTAAAIGQVACAGAANASVIASSPTLPVLGVPYVAAVSAGCFPAVAKCIAPGSLTLTSVVSSTFNGAGQDIVANATYSGELTTLGGMPVGPVMLTGTLEEEVLGRTTSTALGSWTTDLLALSLSGPVLAGTLTLGLDPAHSSRGTSSITQVNSEDSGEFRISSFFDVFTELSLDNPPLSTTRGPIRVTLTTPEPTGLALLLPALLGLVAVRRRR